MVQIRVDTRCQPVHPHFLVNGAKGVNQSKAIQYFDHSKMFPLHPMADVSNSIANWKTLGSFTKARNREQDHSSIDTPHLAGCTNHQGLLIHLWRKSDANRWGPYDKYKKQDHQNLRFLQQTEQIFENWRLRLRVQNYNNHATAHNCFLAMGIGC